MFLYGGDWRHSHLGTFEVNLIFVMYFYVVIWESELLSLVPLG